MLENKEMSWNLRKSVYCFLLKSGKEEWPGSCRQIVLILIQCEITENLIHRFISKAWQPQFN